MDERDELPYLPLLRLRCSRNDLLRRLLERVPGWGHATPGQRSVDGDRGEACYRLAPGSCTVQVHWRRIAGTWEERDCDVVPGATVALRLVLDGASPPEITRLLGLVPTRAFGKGESGPHVRAFRDEGLWIHEVLPQGFHWPEEKVGELLALLRARPGWREVLRLPGIRWAGVTVVLRGVQERMGGFALDPQLLEALVALSLQFDLQIVAE